MKSALHTIKRKNAQGFTLIELLVVIGILAVLLAIVLVAINPARQFSQANDTQRRSDVTEVLNAVHEFMADHNGQLPTALKTLAAGTAYTMTATAGTSNVDPCSDLVTQYIADMPVDPKNGTKASTSGTCTGYNTDYTIEISSTDNRITVCAPDTEIAADPICVTR